MVVGFEPLKIGWRLVDHLSFCTLATVIWLWGFGFVLFDLLTSRTCSVPPHCVDGLVVFTGGKGRIDHAIHLLQQGYGRRLLISGIKSSLRKMLSQKNLCDRVDLGYEAQNTYGNVDETAQWVERYTMGQVMLITTTYHMPRCLRLLRKKMPSLTIFCAAVSDSSPGRTYRSFLEYQKYLGTWVWHR